MWIKSSAAGAALFGIVTMSAWAQTAPEPVPADIVSVPVWAKVATPLSDAQPVPVAFSMGQVEGIAPQLVAGVTAKGYARKVAVDTDTVGQVLVTSVARGDREEKISTEGMAAQFDARDTSQLFPERNLEVKGSKSALIAALERLAQTKPAEPKDKKGPSEAVVEKPISGNSPSNDLASSYRTPTPVAAAAPQKDPVTDIRATNDGCSVRIDTTQGKAFQQSKTQTFTDGKLTADGTCTDSEVSWPLKKSYLACPTDIVDLTAMKAWPQYTLYYTDAAAENHTVSECTKDEDSPYVVAEDESQCKVYLDFAAHQAVPQAALTYINRNNSVVQARGCANSTKSSAVAMTESTSNCSIRHDLAAGVSYELSMWTYVMGGVTYQAAPCADTGRTFPEIAIYTDAGGNYICTPITNMTTKTATLQSRRQITVDGVSQYITECTPDTSTKAILSTTDTCTDPSKWTHDLDAGISYGQERFYYLKTDGSRYYVTGCQNSAVTYRHDVTVTGYQDHDDQLWAYPLSTVTINVGGSIYTIKSSEVLPGAAQLAYVLNGTVDQPTGQSNYDVCNAYRLTTRDERWQRPDGTEYDKAIGAGTPTGPVNVCITTVIKSGNVITATKCKDTLVHVSPYSATRTQTYWDHVSTLNRKQTTNQETGAVVTTTCAEQTATDNYSGMFNDTDPSGQNCATTQMPAAYRCSSEIGIPVNPYIDTEYGGCDTPLRTKTSLPFGSYSYLSDYGTSCPAGF